ncbi:MAG: hypothetical protein ACXVQY_08660 [Actinomycetota bacterium]
MVRCPVEKCQLEVEPRGLANHLRHVHHLPLLSGRDAIIWMMDEITHIRAHVHELIGEPEHDITPELRKKLKDPSPD